MNSCLKKINPLKIRILFLKIKKYALLGNYSLPLRELSILIVPICMILTSLAFIVYGIIEQNKKGEIIAGVVMLVFSAIMTIVFIEDLIFLLTYLKNISCLKKQSTNLKLSPLITLLQLRVSKLIENFNNLKGYSELTYEDLIQDSSIVRAEII